MPISIYFCVGKCTDIYRKIAMVNDFDSSFGYRNLRIHKSAICEPLQGENAQVTPEKLKLAISSIRDHMFSEFIFSVMTRNSTK